MLLKLHRQKRQFAGFALAVLLLPGVVGVSGCGSLRATSRRERVRNELDSNPKYSIGGIQGPIERAARESNWEKKRADLKRNGDPEMTVAIQEFENAQKLYEEGHHKEAEKEFRRIGKERRRHYESFAVRLRRTWGLDDKRSKDMYGTYGDALEEDAIYMMAQAQFAQEHYADAQESYTDLLTRYPSTRYLDPTTRQLFRIAGYWLDFEEVEDEDGNVKLASMHGKDGKPTEKNALSKVPIFPNLTDKTRPLFDTYGRGEQALKSIWLHDSTGPLAPDALMMAANFNLQAEDFVEARRLYQLLREQYPDSHHLKNAYLLGSEVTLATYQGAAYEGKTLEDTIELKQELLAIFPSLTEDERQELVADVEALKDEEIGRKWDLVNFYKVKKDYPAVKLHCYHIINSHPDSRYAEMSRTMLLEVQEDEERWARSPLNFKKKKPIPIALPAVPQKEATPPSEPKKVEAPRAEPAVPEAEPEPTETEQKPSWYQRFNPLRKSEEPPKLEKVPDNSAQRPDDLAKAKPGTTTLPPVTQTSK